MPEAQAATPAAKPAAPAADPKAVAPAAGAAAAAEPTQEFIVDGKPVKLTAAQTKVAVQKSRFADQKLKSMDVLQNKTAALLNALKTPEGLLGILKDPALGASPKAVFKRLMASDIIDDELKEELSKWVYDNVVVQSKKTPEEIERDKKLTDYERLKKAETDRKAQEVSAQQKAEITRIYQGVRTEVVKQINADKTFPQTEGSIRAVVEKLRVMNKQGAPITAENITKALGFVKKDHLLYQQTLLDASEDPEELIARIGEARALKISKALIDRLKRKANQKTPEKKDEPADREKVQDRIDRKLGKTPQGYHVLDI
jgi:hypothetical protein